jgi:surface protein
MADKFPIGNQFQRLTDSPLDETVVFDTLAEAKDYAANNPTAYNGQIIHVKDDRTEEEKASGTYIYEESYYIDSNKELKPICSFTRESLGIFFDMMYDILDGSMNNAKEKLNALWPLLVGEFAPIDYIDYRTEPWNPNAYNEYQMCLEMTEPTEEDIIGDSQWFRLKLESDSSYEVENITVNRNGTDEYYKIITFDSLPATPYFYRGTKIKRVISMIDLSGESTNWGLANMFYGCKNLIEIIDIKNWDTSNVISFYCMFYGCSSLTSLDLSNWNTSNLTDMCSMFANCSSLIELDLSNFDTSKVEDMKIMFQGCTALTNLNISNFNLNKTTDFHASGMFDYCNSLNFDCIDTSNMDYESLLKISTVYENRSK